MTERPKESSKDNDGHGIIISNLSVFVGLEMGIIEESLQTLDFGRAENVVEIGVSACFSCNFLTCVVFSRSLCRIGSRAFWRCPNLTDVDWSHARNLEWIGAEAFALCNNLQSVNLSKVTALDTLSEGTFSNCTALQEVKLAPNLKVIRNNVFHHCQNLKRVDWNAKLFEIQEGAFSFCTSLKTVDLRNAKDLQKLGTRSFFRNESLTLIAFGSRMQEVSSDAFGYCTNIDCIDFSKSNNLDSILKYWYLRSISPNCVKISNKATSMLMSTMTSLKGTREIEVIGKRNLPLLVRLKTTYPNMCPSITRDKLVYVYGQEKTKASDLLGVIHDDEASKSEQAKLCEIEKDYVNAVWSLVCWSVATRIDCLAPNPQHGDGVERANGT